MSQPTQLDAWLKDFPKQETEARIRELERELSGLRGAIAMHESLATNGTEPPKEIAGEPSNRPEAIRRVLRDRGNEPASSGEIKRALLEHGWLTEGQLNLYYAAVSTMTKRGHLLRLQDGRYVLPPSKVDDMP
jgi:hypothetical protein